jgi:nucleoid-associated protein YgaU
VPEPVTQPILELKNIQAVNIATDAATKTAPIEGLEPLIATALSQGMSGAEIDILIAQAVQSGMINVPPHMLRGNGDVDTRAVLGTLVNLPAPKIVRPLGNTYVVRPGDTLAVIAQRYYGTSDAIDDIYWANKDRLANPDALSVGQTLFLPKF